MKSGEYRALITRGGLKIGVSELEKEYDMLLKLWASGSHDYINLTSSYLIANSILVAAIAIILKITPIVVAFSVIGIILCIQMYMGLSLLRTQNAYWRRNLKIIENNPNWKRYRFFNEFYKFRDNQTYLFSFSEISNNKEQQKKLLRHLQDINYTELSQLMKNAKYSCENGQIKIINCGDMIATLEIRKDLDLCYLIKDEDKKEIEIGVVKHGDDIYTKQRALPTKGGELKFKLDFAIKHHEACWAPSVMSQL